MEKHGLPQINQRHRKPKTIRVKGHTLRIERSIGEGNQGEVFKATAVPDLRCPGCEHCKDMPHDTPVAVKIMKSTNRESLHKLESVLNVLPSHPALLKHYFHGEIETDVNGEGFAVGKFAIIMELAEERNHWNIMNVDVLTEEVVHLCEGLMALHEVNITHNDINPTNILYVSYNNRPRIADLSSAMLQYEPRTPISRFHVYAEDPSEARDIFNFGVTLLMMITGVNKTPNHKWVEDRINDLDTTLKHVPNNIKDVIRACCSRDQAARPTAKQIIQFLTHQKPILEFPTCKCHDITEMVLGPKTNDCQTKRTRRPSILIISIPGVSDEYANDRTQEQIKLFMDRQWPGSRDKLVSQIRVIQVNYPCESDFYNLETKIKLVLQGVVNDQQMQAGIGDATEAYIISYEYGNLVVAELLESKYWSQRTLELFIKSKSLLLINLDSIGKPMVESKGLGLVLNQFKRKLISSTERSNSPDHYLRIQKWTTHPTSSPRTENSGFVNKEQFMIARDTLERIIQILRDRNVIDDVELRAALSPRPNLNSRASPREICSSEDGDDRPSADDAPLTSNTSIESNTKTDSDDTIDDSEEYSTDDDYDDDGPNVGIPVAVFQMHDAASTMFYKAVLKLLENIVPIQIVETYRFVEVKIFQELLDYFGKRVTLPEPVTKADVADIADQIRSSFQSNTVYCLSVPHTQAYALAEAFLSDIEPSNHLVILLATKDRVKSNNNELQPPPSFEALEVDYPNNFTAFSLSDNSSSSAVLSQQ